jgi:hypothetical protein
MQTQDQIMSVLTDAEKTLHPRFAKDEHNATVIREWVQKNAQGHWTVGNFTTALRNLNDAGQIHWLSDPNPAPPPPPEPRQPSAADLAAEEAAAKAARAEERAERKRAEASEERMRNVRGKHSQGSNDVIVKPTGYKERWGKSATQERDTTPAATGHIESTFVKGADRLDLDTTNPAQLRAASLAQIKDFTKRLRERDAKK